MKRVILIVAVLILASVTIQAQDGVRAYPGFEVGVFMQDGERGAMAYSGAVQVPLYTIEEFRHFIGVDPSILYSDFGDKETYVVKGYVTYERPLFTMFKVPFQLGGGYGAWMDLKSGEKDDMTDAQTIFISAKTPLFDVKISGETARLDGPDLYFVGIAVKWTR